MKSLIILIILTKFGFAFSQVTITQLPGYPKVIDSLDYTYNTAASSIVEDFNRDGRNEIFISVNLSLSEGRVYLLNEDGRSMPGFPKKVSCFSSYIETASGDVDGDGYLDMVVLSDSLYVFNYLGNLLPGFPIKTYTPSNNLGSKLALYDLDNDKKLEIITGRGDKMFVINYNGTIRNGWPITFRLSSIAGIDFPSIGDLNNDNIPEIIIPVEGFNTSSNYSDSGKIFIKEPNGTDYPGSPIISDSSYSFWFNPAATYKQNGETFFVINSNRSLTGAPNTFRSRTSIYNSNLQLINRFNSAPRYRIYTNSVGYLSEPLSLDIVNGTDFSQVFAFNTTSVLLKFFPVLYKNFEYRNSSMFKINNVNYFSTYDSVKDSSRTKTRFFDKDANQSLSLPVFTFSVQVSSPVMCDLNKDGQLDFLITSLDSPGLSDCTVLNAFTMQDVPYVKENIYWGMFGHDRFRTNQYGFIPPDEPVNIVSNGSNIPESFQLSQNYPNPFNPETKINFKLKTSGHVILKVFDYLGRELQTLVNSKLTGGNYTYNFNGVVLPSGVYFYTLRVNNFTDTKKMILIK
ncbi:MAG: T9SS type A sorting domain-containing protein [Ignavibacteria bacterium]|nr:T9SS type A sorting domain-containing protein [Ignavibacteria bacterium]